MVALIQAEEGNFSWSFDSFGHLYLDHRGIRVLADVEGFGHFNFEGSPAGLEILVDGRLHSTTAGRFEESLLITATGPGSGHTNVEMGRYAPVTGAVVSGDQFAGCGWILSNERPFEIDDMPVRLTATPEFPVPFFQRTEGAGMKAILCPKVRCELVDSFLINDSEALARRGFVAQNISKVSELDSTFPNGTRHLGPVASHLNEVSLDCELPHDCVGIRIRKTYDRFHGLQRARVLVDGRFAGWWYLPEQNRQSRWGVAEFGIGGELVAARARIRLTIDPPAGSPLWSVSEISIFALLPGADSWVHSSWSSSGR